MKFVSINIKTNLILKLNIINLRMPLVTRTVILYIDDELVEVDIEIYEPVKENICRLCETVELAEHNDIICPDCWLTVEEVDPKVELVEDEDMSYRSFKEMVRKRNQSDVSEISEISETNETDETIEK